MFYHAAPPPHTSTAVRMLIEQASLCIVRDGARELEKVATCTVPGYLVPVQYGTLEQNKIGDVSAICAQKICFVFEASPIAKTAPYRSQPYKYW